MTHPLHGDNKLKLGVFGTNVSHGCAISTAEGTLRVAWPDIKQIAQVADRGDDTAVDRLCSVLIERSQSIPKEFMEAMKFHLKAGWGGYPLVGTPDKIVSELEKLSASGIDGVVLSWPNYTEGMASWSRDVMPRLEQAGLRRRVTGPSKRSVLYPPSPDLQRDA